MTILLNRLISRLRKENVYDADERFIRQLQQPPRLKHKR